MEHTDHVRLLRDGIPGEGGCWADFGAGRGAFTLALAELIGPTGQIYAIDRDARALAELERAMQSRFPRVALECHVADFAEPLELPSLDGLVIANALHFQKQQSAVSTRLREYLRPGGRFLIVEYNIKRGNPAVPHPVPFRRWEELARGAGFYRTELLVRRPSRFLHEIYSAVSR